MRTGQIIAIYDNSRSGVSQSGRVISVSANRLGVVLDRPRSTNGSSFTLTLSNPTAALFEQEASNTTDAESYIKSQLLTYQVVSITADEKGNMIANLGTPADLNIVPGTIWGLTSDTVAPQLARVLNVDEKGGNEYEVLAISHNPQKYEYVEDNVQFETSPFSKKSASRKKKTICYNC